MTVNGIFTWCLIVYGAFRIAIDFAMWIEPKRKNHR